jgi:xylulokinase
VTSLFVGLDLGTSSVKAGLYDQTGQELVVVREPLSIQTPEPGWTEQDPHEWWSGVQKVVRGLVSESGAASVRGVGLSGQCPGHVLVDLTGEPLGPAIIWRDRRAQEEAAWLAQQVSPQEAVSWVGSLSLGDATMTPARLLWLKRHRRADWKRAAKVLQPKDYLGLLLTGSAVTDRHTAFLLVHPDTSHYHPDFLGLLEISETQLPLVHPPAGMVGSVSRKAALVTGLPEGTPVFVGTIDAYCDTLAGGGFLPGQAVDGAGTSEIISLGTTRDQDGNGVFLACIDASTRFLCGPTQVGGCLLDWLVRSFYLEMGANIDYSRLEGFAAQVPAGADGLLFLPYLHGERAPIWDAAAAGAFLGVTSAHDRRHFTRAVYEGVGYAVRHVLEACEDASGQPAERVITCGGGASSRFWNEVKAGILQKPVQPIQAKASTCLGAAMLAAVGAGYYSNLTQAWRGMSRLAEEIAPDASLAERYEQRYGEYRRAYPALQTVFRGR